MTYNEFINELNIGNIKQIKFFVKNYNHCKDCSIKKYSDIIIFRGKQIAVPTIECKLTSDNSEIHNFIDKFDEGRKLFKIKGITYTLKQLWDKIEITDIIY